MKISKKIMASSPLLYEAAQHIMFILDPIRESEVFQCFSNFYYCTSINVFPQTIINELDQSFTLFDYQHLYNAIKYEFDMDGVFYFLQLILFTGLGAKFQEFIDINGISGKDLKEVLTNRFIEDKYFRKYSTIHFLFSELKIHTLKYVVQICHEKQIFNAVFDHELNYLKKLIHKCCHQLELNVSFLESLTLNEMIHFCHQEFFQNQTMNSLLTPSYQKIGH